MEVKIEDIEEKVIQGVIEQILRTEGLQDLVALEVKSAVQDHLKKNMQQVVSARLDEEMTKILGKEIQPVNTWGERVGEPTTISGELDKQARDFWTCKVDSSGRPDNSGYGSRKSRAEYMVGNVVTEEFKKLLTQNVDLVSAAVKQAFREDLVKQVDEYLNSAFRKTR